jgi:hypothetical protein
MKTENMKLPALSIAIVLLAVPALAGDSPHRRGPAGPGGPAGAAAGIARVFDPPRLPEDARLGKPRDLNGYFPFTPPSDPAAWKDRARQVREGLLVAAGLWPLPERCPLDPVIHGAIDRGDYTIEKVFFRSCPGFYVTGNLYRPKVRPEVARDGRRPAALSPHGHWQNGRLFERGEKEAKREIDVGAEKTMEGARFPLQARCAQLARMGCVVFHYDMVGNADSKQIGHAQGFRDAEALLRLQSAFGLQTWNSIRALDFLSGLPDVDPARIGVTGASGGGTQTFILCAIDDRPAVAFPAVMVSTAMQGGCVCENAPYLRVGTGNIEIAALCAPRPLGMTGANDWTLEIETKGLPELKKLYAMLGVPDLVMAKCFPKFDHNYNGVSREVMYSWMNRHLKLGLEDPVPERPFIPVPPAELSVFDASHPRPADAVDAAGLRKWWAEASDQQMTALRPRDARGYMEFYRVLSSALPVMIGSRPHPPESVDARELSVSDGDAAGGPAFTVRKMLLSRKGSGEEVPAVALVPKASKGRVTVLVHPEGKAGALADGNGRLKPLVTALLAAGSTVVALDPFLTGEYHLPNHPTPAPAVNAEYAGYTFGYNRTLLGERVHDILTAVAWARKLGTMPKVSIAGLEGAGPWALIAGAIAEPLADRTFADLGRFDFKAVKEPADPMMLPGAVKYGGIPAFAGLCAGQGLWIAAPPPGMDLTRDIFKAAGTGKSLRIQEAAPPPEALAAWLAGVP